MAVGCLILVYKDHISHTMIADEMADFINGDGISDLL
jgi:hypothetical protein